ncbi:GNAT family N-acetyltransferase [Candidatus Altiarchaeota archaeon]
MPTRNIRKPSGQGSQDEIKKVQLLPNTKTERYRSTFILDDKVYGMRLEHGKTGDGGPMIMLLVEPITGGVPDASPEVFAHGRLFPSKEPLPELRQIFGDVKTAELMRYNQPPGSKETVPELKKGRGVGTAVLRELEKIAFEQDIDVLYAITDEKNVPARKSLEKSGYTLHPKPYNVDEWVDMLYYKKLQSKG